MWFCGNFGGEDSDITGCMQWLVESGETWIQLDHNRTGAHFHIWTPPNCKIDCRILILEAFDQVKAKGVLNLSPGKANQ